MPPDIALPAAALHPAVALLARETRVRPGPVPCDLDGEAVAEGRCALRGDGFLLRAEGGIRFLYRRGEGVTLDQPADADPRDIALWLTGSVYAAVAAINGLMPLHASAVAHRGRVFAFTGPSGAGKSTLAAALGHEGLALFCDDTLVLDLTGDGPITCLPGHKRLKLWPEGIALAGAAAREQVASDYPKTFAEPAAGIIAEPLPLAELVFLEPGQAPALHPLAAGARIAALMDDHYTAHLFTLARALERPAWFALLAGIAARMPMRRFARPFEPSRFAEGAHFIAQHIRATGAP